MEKDFYLGYFQQVSPFNALILPILRGCLKSFSMIWVMIASVPGLFVFAYFILILPEFLWLCHVAAQKVSPHILQSSGVV